jgi:hypothetical protein
VLHLHGHWQDPDSVVLGIRSYESVLGNAHTQTVLRALCLTADLVFVGFGAGLADPNFGALLRWIARCSPAAKYRHFRLARTGEVESIRRQHPPEERVFVVPYGERHDDLASFLRGLGGPRRWEEVEVPSSWVGRFRPTIGSSGTCRTNATRTSRAARTSSSNWPRRSE